MQKGSKNEGGLFPLITIGGIPDSLVRVNQLFCDIVEEIPAPIGKRALQEGQRHESHIRGLEEFKGMFWLQPKIFTYSEEKGVH